MSVEAAALALPYARAAFGVAQEQGGDALKVWDEQLRALAAVASHPDVHLALQKPGVSRQQRLQTLLGLFVEAGGKSSLDEGLRRLLAVMAEHNRLQNLPELATCYQRLVDERRGVHPVIVSTATSLSKKAQEKLEAIASKQFPQEGLQFTYKTDERVGGGFIAQCGDWVLDASAVSRLNTLSAALSSQN